MKDIDIIYYVVLYNSGLDYIEFKKNVESELHETIPDILRFLYGVDGLEQKKKAKAIIETISGVSKKKNSERKITH